MKNYVKTLVILLVFALLGTNITYAEKKEENSKKATHEEQTSASELKTKIPKKLKKPSKLKIEKEKPKDKPIEEPIEEPVEEPIEGPIEENMEMRAMSAAGSSTDSQQTTQSASLLNKFKGKSDVGLFSGSLNYSYPLWIPQGRKNMMPDITLRYSSNNRNFESLIGYGWSLPTNAIFRTPRKGVDSIYTEERFSADIFGNYEELVLIDATNQIYAPVNESSYNEYKFQNGTWIMRDTQGNSYTFGQTLATQQNDPSDTTKIYKWMLEKVEDTNGNSMRFSYYKNEGQIYPNTIRYTNDAQTDGIYEIKFNRTPRPKYSSYTRGFKTTSNYLIDSIEINSYHTGSAQLVRSYDLNHTAANNAIQLLTSITVKKGTESLPPLEIEYYDGTENTAGKKINLIKKITHPKGGVQTFTYKPSTAKRTQTGIALNPIPFIVHTVNKITTQASATDPVYTTTYEYEGAHYYYDNLDAYKKEYAGFHLVTITDALENVKKIYFHQSENSPDNTTSSLKGEYQDHIAKKGRTYREEQYDNQNNLFSLKINKWNKTVLSDADLEKDRFFIFLEQTVSAIYDGDSDYKAVGTSYEYDNYGNITKTTDYGEITLSDDAGNFSDTGTDKIVSEIEYAINSDAHLLAYPKQQETKDYNNSTIAKNKNYYDNLPFGQISQGNQTKTETLTELPETYISTTTEFNTHGLPISTTNPREYTTTIGYDSYNLYPTSITNAKDHTVSSTYDYSFGIATETTDPNGAKTTTEYDQLGRVTTTKITNPETPSEEITTSTFTYDYTNNPYSVTQTTYAGHDNIEITSKTYQDGFGRTIQTKTEAEDSDYVTQSVIYDELGRTKKELLPVFSQTFAFENINQTDLGTAYTYDALGRPTSMTNNLGTTAISYDQWEKTVVDSESNQKDFVFDARKNLIEVIEHLDNVEYSTFYTYDVLNNLTKITDAKNNIRNFTYDFLGRKISEEDLHTISDTTFGTWTYAYDANGNLISKTDPKAQEINYSYDELDRVLTEDYLGNPGIETTYTYDLGSHGKGKLTTVESSAATQTYTYDILGRITEEQKTIDGTNYTTAYTHNLLNNPLSITYPDNTTINYNYNNAALLESVQKGTGSVVSNLDYSPIGSVTQLDYANGVSSTNTYDINKLYRLTHKTTTNSTSNKLQDLAYDFDSVGNILQIVDTSETVLAKTSDYVYDDLYRLTSATITNSANQNDYTRTFQYDILGNILNKSDIGAYTYTGGENATSSSVTSNPHAVTQAGTTSYAYDANGNLTSDGTWTHAWDYGNRLVSSAGSGSGVVYGYDHTTNRVKKVADGKTTYYINQYYDVEDGAQKKYVFAGNMKVATLSGSTVAYHHEDHLGGANIDTDETGEILEQIDYFPYGSVNTEVTDEGYENDYKFTGKELDDETDLYYYEARYYDAKIGRFTGIDPWFGNLSDPQSFNKYAYTLNNPLKYTDPTGMIPDPTDAIVAGCGPAAPACFAIKEGAEILAIYAAKEIAKSLVTELLPASEELEVTESIPETKEEGITSTSTPSTTNPTSNTTSIPVEQSVDPNVTTTPAWSSTDQSGCGVNMSCASDGNPNGNFRDLLNDIQNNPANWEKIDTKLDPNQPKNGKSEREIWQNNDTGDKIERHNLERNGKPAKKHPHYKPNSD